MSCWHLDSGYDGTQQMACCLLEIDNVRKNSCCSSVVCHTGFWRAGAGSWWLNLLCLFRAMGWDRETSPGAVQGDLELSRSPFPPPKAMHLPTTQLEFDTRLLPCGQWHSMRAEDKTEKVGWHPTESLSQTLCFLSSIPAHPSTNLAHSWFQSPEFVPEWAALCLSSSGPHQILGSLSISHELDHFLWIQCIFLLCVSMCPCVCVGGCLCVQLSRHVYMWRPQVSLGYCSLSTIHLVFGTGSLATSI